ncbi:MAG: 16S rRNA (cytosine(967)-C(5))-methyltransferase RsmB [Sneathiella sp.]|uniref:16S rRNA (cytosine(967)-C(5))-methyltransferase RsmB n=1 Tax=Sneathiella sp. TaxID=1964365 RepID=UPI00300282AA
MNDIQINPRRAAVHLLTRVLQKHQLLEEILNPVLKGLSPRDRSLSRALASTTLRHLGTIDGLIDKMLDRPLSDKMFEIRHILRIGIAQILFLNIPSHAAVHDTVELVSEKSKYRGMINALLRRTDRQGAKLLSQMDVPKHNTPSWLWDKWEAHYGNEITHEIAAANMTEAKLDISVKGDPQKWAKLLEADILANGSLRRPVASDVTSLPGFNEGEWWVQDAAATIPAALFGDVKGKAILDNCAAPGGKTAQLAAAGAKVIALDRSKGRMKRLIENMDRLGLSVDIQIGEAENFSPKQQLDGILLDAPCSSTGTLRRHPDVAYLKTSADIEKLCLLQTRLLDAASKQLTPGAILVYSVCSLQAEEGENQIDALLKRDSSLKRQPVNAKEIGGLSEVINTNGDIRCLPQHSGGMDGFFAARLIKLSAS